MTSDTATSAMPEWEEKLRVMLRIYGNYHFDCGAYKGESLSIYAKMESCASDSKDDIVKYVAKLIREQ